MGKKKCFSGCFYLKIINSLISFSIKQGFSLKNKSIQSSRGNLSIWANQTLLHRPPRDTKCLWGVDGVTLMNENKVPWKEADFKRHVNVFYCILSQWNEHTTVHIWLLIFWRCSVWHCCFQCRHTHATIGYLTKLRSSIYASIQRNHSAPSTILRSALLQRGHSQVLHIFKNATEIPLFGPHKTTS